MPSTPRTAEAPPLLEVDGLAVTFRTEEGPLAAVNDASFAIGSGERIGIDRDEDGIFDRDELDACSDPANAASVPGDPSTDIDADGIEDFTDVDAFVAVLLGAPQEVNHAPRCDLNCDGVENGLDVQPFVNAFLSPSLALLTPRVEELDADVEPRSTDLEPVSGH